MIRMKYRYVLQGLAATKGFLGATRVHLVCAVHRTIPKTTTCARKAELVETIDAVGPGMKAAGIKAVNCFWLARRRTCRHCSEAKSATSGKARGLKRGMTRGHTALRTLTGP